VPLHDQTKTRTHLDREGEAAQARAADSAGGCGEVVPRQASCHGWGYFRQPADFRGQLAGVEGAGAGVFGEGEVRVHRSAVQHGQRVYALRRRVGAFDLAGFDARSVGDYSALVI